MNDNLPQEAIKLALECKWIEAIKINKKILKANPTDIEALNRLARSFFECGKIRDAKKCSLSVLKIDPTNNIALKALDKYKQFLASKNYKKELDNRSSDGNKNTHLDPSIFIDEPGKTKLTNLINVGSIKTCSCLNCGDEIFLATHTHKVSLKNSLGQYIGKLPDDLSAKLRRFIKGGNEYKVFVKSVEGKNIKVIIKETKRGSEFKNIQSFPRESSESVAENFSDSDI